MKEFDQCPGCNQDLLLEDPEQENGLHCLNCGYICQATEPSPDTPLSLGSEMEKLAYWRSRCKAAESVIESIETENGEMFATVQQVWQAIKEEGEPA